MAKTKRVRRVKEIPFLARFSGLIEWVCPWCHDYNKFGARRINYEAKCRGCDRRLWLGVRAFIPSKWDTQVYDNIIPYMLITSRRETHAKLKDNRLNLLTKRVSRRFVRYRRWLLEKSGLPAARKIVRSTRRVSGTPPTPPSE